MNLSGLTVVALAASLILLRAPYALGLGDRTMVRLLFLSPLLIAATFEILRVSRRRVVIVDRRVAALGIAVTILLLVSIGRGLLGGGASLAGTLSQIVILLLPLTISACVCWQGDSRSVVSLRKLTFAALPIYVGANVLLHALGWHSPLDLYESTREAAIPRAIGISIDRVLFPMAAGWNAFGLVAAASLSGTLVISLVGRRRVRLIAFAGVLISLWAVVLSDSRLALASAIASAVAVFMARRRRVAKLIPWTPAVFMFLPIIATTVLQLFPASVLTSMSRSGSATEFVTLSNRTLVWESALGRLGSFEPIHVVGYGMSGHVISGVAREYGDLFGNSVQMDIAGVHNMYLQTVFDVGYVGLLLLMMMAVVVLKRLVRDSVAAPSDWGSAAATSVFMYFAMAASVDQVPIFYIGELWFVAVFLAVSTSATTRRS